MSKTAPKKTEQPPRSNTNQARRGKRSIEQLTKEKEEDYEFIRAALNGNQKAYDRLMQRYKGRVYKIVYSLVSSRQEAEDLVQEAFIRAFGALDRFNFEFPFSTWLYKIATNNCIDHLRKKKLKVYSLYRRSRHDDSGEDQMEIPDLSFFPDRKLLQNEKKKIIFKALEELPEKYKEVILLRHMDEQTYEEISQKLNIPIGTVKVRIFRAREMLNKFLRNKIEQG